jgi:DNA-directed RNA polymerase specialized sigma24 family protein
MAPARTAQLDPQRDFEGLRAAARQRFLARARRAGQHAFHDLDEAADDAYQEAWLELVRRPAPPVDDPAGYLAGIMWHRFHRRELRPVRAPAAPLDDRLQGGPAPDEVVAGREALRAVQEALSDLPERERAAVLLRSLGLGHDDVAASLGVSSRRARKLSESGHRRLALELAAASAGERCTAVASTLRALSLGWEIAGRRRTRLERHLAACPACRATVAALRREGRLAVLPVVLADGSKDGLVERAAQAATRAWDRAPVGSVEASAGALGGALATKVVAGCVAAGVAAGCVAIVTRDETAPEPVRPAAAPVSPASAPPTTPADAAQPRDARTASVGKRRSEPARVHRARERVRGAQQSVRRAVRRTEQAQQRTQEAQQQVQEAQVRTQEAQQQVQQAQQHSQEAQQKVADAQAKVEQAATGVDQALEKAFGGGP